MSKVMIQAHRGASAYAPENTLPSFKLAVEMGADGIECDIHLTKDAHFIVCHDHKVDRTSSGAGLISELTLKQIKALDFGVKFDPRFTGTTAPTLEEMLEVVKNMSVVNIEIKRFEHEMGLDAALDKFYGILKDFDVISNTIVSSFDADALERLKQLHGDIYTCLLYGRLRNSAEKAKLLGCDAIHPDFTHLKVQTVEAAHRRDMKVNCWTVDGENHIRQMIEMGCDGIITNKPDVALRVRDNI